MVMFSKMEKFHGENIQGTYHTPPLPASYWMPSPPKEDLPKSLPTITSCPLSKFWCNLTIWTMFLNKWPYTRQDSQTADSSYFSINHPSHTSQQPLCQGRWYEAECMAWGDGAILWGIPLAHSFAARLQSNQKWSQVPTRLSQLLSRILFIIQVSYTQQLFREHLQARSSIPKLHFHPHALYLALYLFEGSAQQEQDKVIALWTDSFN